jgi:tRNA U34 5-methylaminomethyl-2-thiouridine-forming methyltransferase MnmC
MKVQPVITGDLSHTLFVPELNEHYHSVFGAISESKHIFIETGLDRQVQDRSIIRILEIGFGTGLNALLTYYEALSKKIRIHFTAIEPFPLDRSVWEKLNYPEILKYPGASEVFHKLHDCPWNATALVSDFFLLEKRMEKLESIVLSDSSIDLVYFDAFGPDVQPELWTEKVFKKICHIMDQDSVLVTYSSKGSVKRALLHSGFQVEKLPGPMGKREIIRASKAG